MAAEGGNAFEILGRIGVDNVALLRELKESERIAKASRDRLSQIWESAKVPVTPGRIAGTGTTVPPGTIFVGGRAVPTAASIFSRQGQAAARAFEAAQAARAAAAGGGGAPGGGGGPGGLGGLGGGQFAQGARGLFRGVTRGFGSANMLLGIGAGGVAGAGVAAGLAVGRVIQEYVEQAREATKVTAELRTAWAGLDAGAVEAGVKKIGASITEYNVQVDIAEGKVASGFWQKILAWSAVASEAVTGSIDAQIESLKRYGVVAEQVARKLTLPKEQAESAEKAAAILGRQGQQAAKAAASAQQLADAYALQGRALRDANAAGVKKIELDRDAEVARARQPFEQAAGKILSEAQGRIKGGGFDARAGVGKKILDDAVAAAEEQVKLADAAGARVVESAKVKVADLGADLEQSLSELGDKAREALARVAADEEGFTQRSIQRAKDRVASVAAAAAQTLESEHAVAEVRRQQVGAVEAAAALEDRLAASRAAATAPIVAGIQAANEKYESQKRALQDLIAGGVDVMKNRAELADLEKSSAEEVADLRRKLAAEEARLEAQAVQAREARVQKEIELEEKRFSHRVSMGRASMQEEMAQQRAAATDPRRTLDQQEAAERQLLETRRQYADEYFKYYQSLGQSTWQEQLRVAESFLSQTVEGSQQWFQAVQRVSDVYKGINDQAKNIFQQQVSIAEQEARRTGRRRIGVGDIGGLVQRARERDVRALGGGRVEIGDISAALSRRELFKTMDREGLTPGAAFGRAMQDPQAQLAETLSRVSTSVEAASGAAKSGMAGVTDAAGGAAAALNELTAAALSAAGAMAGAGRGGESENGEAPAARKTRVLPSAGGKVFTNMPQLDSLLGQNLDEASRRAPRTAEVVQ